MGAGINIDDGINAVISSISS